MKLLGSQLLLLASSLAQAAVLWDGRFNDLTGASDLNKWSWSNQVGPFQYYIHGSGAIDKYISLSSSFKVRPPGGRRHIPFRGH